MLNGNRCTVTRLCSFTVHLFAFSKSCCVKQTSLPGSYLEEFVWYGVVPAGLGKRRAVTVSRSSAFAPGNFLYCKLELGEYLNLFWNVLLESWQDVLGSDAAGMKQGTP